jgi:protein-disulfide isomerase/uncharacterized membrane protein
VSRKPPASRGNVFQPAARPVLTLLNLATVLALAGIALSGVILWVHAGMAREGASYTSFCNVNSAVNCDVVLGSPFAKVFGVPVAWFAIAAYAALAVLFQLAARADAAVARRALQAACTLVIGAAAFSAYMAILSFVVLQTVCLMCSGLYLVAAGLLAIALIVPSRFARDTAAGGRPPLTRTALGALGAAAVLGVAGLAGATWPGHRGDLGENLSLEDLRAADPEFYDWYVSLPVVDAPSERGHAVGDAAAPVTIVEFSDFECAYCARNHVILKQLLERRPDLVRVVYRHFPLDALCNEALDKSVHARACRAAEAAECAGLQGRFQEMADAMFADQRRLFEANLFAIANGLDLDEEVFRRCMEEHATRDAVLADSRAGNRLDLRSTPTLFINGRRVEGTLEDLDRYEHAAMIEARLEAHERRKPQGS